MADSATLLSQIESTYSSDLESPSLEKRHPSIDSMIERCIEHFGWAQFLRASLVCLVGIFDAQQSFISIFTDAEPTWHCTPLSDQSCSSFSNICQLPKSSWAWDFPAHTSIISEWSLQCGSSFVKGLPASSFFVGCLVGGLVLTTVADSSLGRKNVLLLSCLLMSLSGILTVVISSNVWIYSALRFVCGFGRSTIGTCALVLATELVGNRWRGQVGIIGFLCFTLGFLSLPAIAYLCKGSSWRLVYLWTCIPTIFYCLLVHFLVPESPRWLYMRGRKEEFVAALKCIAPTDNNNSFTPSFFRESFYLQKESTNIGLYSAMKMLLEKKWAIRRLLGVMVVGFGIGMVYYGMPLGLGNLDFNLYLSVTLNALAELPASVVTFFLIGRLNKKSALVGFSTISGFCSVICVVLRSDNLWWMAGLKIGMEMGSFFSACTACNVLLIYTLELFPTCVRSSAMSLVRQAIVLGGVISPVLVAGGKGDGLVSYGVFGVTIGCCGLFAAACLTDRIGGTLSNTMEEEEHKEREGGRGRERENTMT